LSQENIGKPVTEFIDSIRSFTKVSNDLADSGKRSIETFNSISESLGTFSKSLESANTNINSLNLNTTQLSESSKNLYEVNVSAKSGQGQLLNGIESFSKSIKSNNENITSLTVSVGTLKSVLANSSTELTGFAEKFRVLESSLGATNRQIIEFDNILKNSSANLKVNGESSKSLSSDADALKLTIRQVISELSILETNIKKMNSKI
jgi:chromosome segregation ATPase